MSRAFNFDDIYQSGAHEHKAHLCIKYAPCACARGNYDHEGVCNSSYTYTQNNCKLLLKLIIILLLSFSPIILIIIGIELWVRDNNYSGMFPGVGIEDSSHRATVMIVPFLQIKYRNSPTWVHAIDETDVFLPGSGCCDPKNTT